MREVQDLWKPQ